MPLVIVLAHLCVPLVWMISTPPHLLPVINGLRTTGLVSSPLTLKIPEIHEKICTWVIRTGEGANVMEKIKTKNSK